MKKYYKKIRHLSEYILFGLLMTILKTIGLKRSVAVCSFIARSLGPKFKVTRIAKKNLNKVLGNNIDTPKMIEQIWDNFGKYIGEFPFINELSKAEMDDLFVMEGVENIRLYQEKKTPFLLFLAHQANWEFVIRHITSIYPKFAVIYRKANNPYVDKKILETRNNDENILMIPKGPSGAKDLVKAIKNGYSIGMLVDQKMNDGIEVPFFNRPAMTASAIAKLSLQYNYPIIPCQVIRTYGSNFKLIIHPEIKYQKHSGNKESDIYNIMLLINQKIEEWIIENPSQWFWFHNRWKDL